MTSFEQLGLSEPIIQALNDLGFEQATEIQEKAIPLLLKGDKDFIGLAQTGTGKTAAFGLPIIERIDSNLDHTQALILAPTRELGQQIAEQLKLYSKYKKKISSLAVYGGAAISNQIKDLKRPQHIIIATPGRLIDLIKRRAVNLSKLEYLVLDEADEMLNMGFKEEIDEILSYAPEERVTWLISATMPNEIRRIVKKYMVDPVEVRVNTKNEVNANIEHQFAVMRQANKAEALTRMLDVYPDMRGLVFCRTRRDTQNLAELLLKLNYKADALHGDLSQALRDKVMRRFKEHSLQVLVATDVAARGIDVNDLTHVFHYTLPDEVAYYTHRSGRTARAGKKGISMSFINSREMSKIDRISSALKIEFKKVLIPSTADIAESRIEHWCLGVLEQKTKGKIEPEILEKVNILFSQLTKEEIIAKFLAAELDTLNLGSTEDINQAFEKRRPSRDSGGGRGGRGGRGDFHRKGRGDGKPGRSNRSRSFRGGKPGGGSGSGPSGNRKSTSRRKRT